MDFTGTDIFIIVLLIISFLIYIMVNVIKGTVDDIEEMFVDNMLDYKGHDVLHVSCVLDKQVPLCNMLEIVDKHITMAYKEQEECSTVDALIGLRADIEKLLN